MHSKKRIQIEQTLHFEIFQAEGIAWKYTTSLRFHQFNVIDVGVKYLFWGFITPILVGSKTHAKIAVSYLIYFILI